jgi:hypothetical protein
VASPNGGDGKTSVTLSMAQRFAERGHRVLAVDADTRKRTLSVNAGVQGPGLAGGLSRLVPLPEAVDSNEVLGCDILGTAGPLADPRLAQDVSAIFALIEAARASLRHRACGHAAAQCRGRCVALRRRGRQRRPLVALEPYVVGRHRGGARHAHQVEADPCGVVVTRAKPSALRQTAFSGYFRRV